MLYIIKMYCPRRAERDDRIAKLVSLPKTHKIYGALAMGYPRLKFKKWPDRNPVKATWM
jgi:nitroreductase